MKTQRSILSMVLLGALAAGCSKPPAPEVKPVQPVRTQTVAVAPPPTGVRYSASIEPFEQVALSFKSSGYVDDLLRRRGADGSTRVAQAGDLVTRGTVLARVREADYRERVNQGRARVAESEAARKKAGLDLERAKALFANDSLTKPELDGAQANFDAGAARVASAQADLALAITALQDCALTAPSSGVLLERKVEVGTLVNAGSVGFVLGDVHVVKARVGVPDSMVHTVTPGEPIAVSVEAASEAAFTGRVSAVAPAADPQSRVFDIEVTIANADGRLRPGMIGTVALGGPSHATANAQLPLTVPLTAVVRPRTGAGQYAVLVVERRGEQDIASIRAVELGEVLGNGVAILKGVQRGDRVVVSGATLLTDGDPVRVIS